MNYVYFHFSDVCLKANLLRQGWCQMPCGWWGKKPCNGWFEPPADRQEACRTGKGGLTHVLAAARIQKSLVIYIFVFSHPHFSRIGVDSWDHWGYLNCEGMVNEDSVLKSWVWLQLCLVGFFFSFCYLTAEMYGNSLSIIVFSLYPDWIVVSSGLHTSVSIWCFLWKQTKTPSFSWSQRS